MSYYVTQIKHMSKSFGTLIRQLGKKAGTSNARDNFEQKGLETGIPARK